MSCISCGRDVIVALVTKAWHDHAAWVSCICSRCNCLSTLLLWEHLEATLIFLWVAQEKSLLKLIFEVSWDLFWRWGGRPNHSVGILLVHWLVDDAAALLAKPKVLVEASHCVWQVTTLALALEEHGLAWVGVGREVVILTGDTKFLLLLN